MAMPAMGILDDRERERITREKMEKIRRAIVGDPDRFDEDGRRIIGGYVGDMETWPDLWEPQAEEKPTGGPYSFGYRPSGHFAGKKWKWDCSFRKLTDDDVNNNDHIGGLETENEGQPAALWTDNPKGDGTEMEDPDRWKGPYIVPPVDRKPDDSGHWAETDEGYEELEPKWNGTEETWEDGDYDDTNGGEHFDEKESFRLLQTDGRLADGWGRAFRFFITANPDRPGSTIFWIISEGPDHEGTYPTKGTFNGTSWVVNSDDVMSKAYDEDDEYNKDNIVMKIYSHEWEAVFDEINEKKKMVTEDLFLRIKKAVLGALPGGMNDGFTGDVCRRPKLFRWEDNGTPVDPADDYWDDEDGTLTAYTKGQPRELWTRRPNSSDSGDDVAEPAWAHAGIGWRHEYLQTPWGFNGDQFIKDAWDREVLFFNDDTNDAVIILSHGPDGKFDFGTTNAEKTEPVKFTEAIDVTTYNPNDAGGYNADNIVLIVSKSDRHPGFFTLNKFTVNNATSGTTKTCLFYDDGSKEIKVAGTDGTLNAGVWEVGADTPPPYAFYYHDTSSNKIKTGARYLVFWNDTDGDDVIDVGEHQYTAIYNVIAGNVLEPRDDITLDTSVNFTAAP